MHKRTDLNSARARAERPSGYSASPCRCTDIFFFLNGFICAAQSARVVTAQLPGRRGSPRRWKNCLAMATSERTVANNISADCLMNFCCANTTKINRGRKLPAFWDLTNQRKALIHVKLCRTSCSFPNYIAVPIKAYRKK